MNETQRGVRDDTLLSSRKGSRVMTVDKNKYILSINGMSKSFGRNKVLKHINLNVKPGTIMGLMGENGAGKSTMMKCLFGTYQKDEGTIILDGREVNFSGPKDALENGVAMVHQELNQCLERSVVDNMFLGRYPKNSFGIVDEGRMKKETANLFRQLGITANLTQPMKKMSVSQRQMCEIAKAISYHSKVIVLDEPTSSLTAPEVEKLFKMMRQLKAQGISLIYISHKMDEIFNICDEISVLRDGSLVMTKECKDTDMNELISAMVGRSLDNRFPPVDNEPGEKILSVQNLSSKYAPKIQNVSFDIRKGEIFGFLGANGAGKTTAMRMLTGLSRPTSGHAEVAGFDVAAQHEQVKRHIGYMSQKFSLYGDLTVKENLRLFGGIYGMAENDIKRKSHEAVERLDMKALEDTLVRELPPGWKQKIAFTVSIMHNPEVVFLDEPTGGVDPKTRQQFWRLIYEAAGRGITVFVTTHYMDEAEYCDRISIMVDGQIRAMGTPGELKSRYGCDDMDGVFTRLAMTAKRGERAL